MSRNNQAIVLSLLVVMYGAGYATGNESNVPIDVRPSVEVSDDAVAPSKEDHAYIPEEQDAEQEQGALYLMDPEAEDGENDEGDEGDEAEVFYEDPADVCTYSPDQFFTLTFEELVNIVYPGEGYTGEETIYCCDYEEDNPQLLADLRAADTDEDDEIDQTEFDAWKDQKGYDANEQ